MVYEENTLLRSGGEIYRILSSHKEEVLVINCLRRTMPCWRSQEEFSESIVVAENELFEANKQSEDMLASYDSAQAHKRFTVIAGILPVIGDKNLRSMRIREAADFFGVSRQTIRKYLCDYLIFQDIRVLALVKPAQARELTADEKTMRWALNKYYYNPQKLALTRVYERMIRERYTSDEGIVMEDHPSIYQFRRFQKKYEKLQTKIISRQGIKDYQRNHRPLLGDGVQSFAPAAGWAMLDGTVCDIYLINDQGELVGRPELTAAVDVYSGMCIGYSLGWEGGVHSLRGLMMNILVDKQDYCRRFGITLAEHEWPVNGVLPGTVVTDMGTEYTSGTFEHLSELGVTIINLESYRPELKGPIEKFFDVVQELYKPDLKGFGVIEPDYQERGAHDYRKDACLTLREFETILIRCIIHYNAHRIVEEFPFTEEMLKREVDPYSNEIFLYGRTLSGTHEIPVGEEELILTLLPRCEGRFTREGLKVNGLRYRRPKEDHSFNEDYLRGGTVTCAYNPDSVDIVWLLRDGAYIPFDLIESRFVGKPAQHVLTLKDRQRELVRSEREKQLQAKVDLAGHIEVITSRSAKHYSGETKVRNIRDSRRKERMREHVDYTRKTVKGGTD